MLVAVPDGVPAGALNIVPGTDAAAIGEELTTNPMVRKLTFTGSTTVGKQLMLQAASSVKKVTIGPLINEAAVVKVERLLADALARGA